MKKNTMKIFNEPHDIQLSRVLETIRQGAIAGAAGGLADITWVTLYATATGANPATLARGVTTATGVTALSGADPIALGVTVHMGIVRDALNCARFRLAGAYLHVEGRQ